MTAKATVVFATRNRGKVAELTALLEELSIRVIHLDELDEELADTVEDGATFAANAIKKAKEVSLAAGLPALADDSGLEVDALGGRPGVHSARFAGPRADDQANNRKLLAAMADVPDEKRTARFHAALALAHLSGTLGENVIVAEGVCEGMILRAPRGQGGFGYDPLFCVPAAGATFAEMEREQKSQLSHRGRAIRAMLPSLVEYFRLAKPGASG